MVLGTFGNQSVMNGKLFLANFEKRLKDTHIQKCMGDMNSSKKCRTYREIREGYRCENYMDCNIRHDLRMFYTIFRLSSHKFLVIFIEIDFLNKGLRLFRVGLGLVGWFRL